MSIPKTRSALGWRVLSLVVMMPVPQPISASMVGEVSGAWMTVLCISSAKARDCLLRRECSVELNINQLGKQRTKTDSRIYCRGLRWLPITCGE